MALLTHPAATPTRRLKVSNRENELLQAKIETLANSGACVWLLPEFARRQRKFNPELVARGRRLLHDQRSRARLQYTGNCRIGTAMREQGR